MPKKTRTEIVTLYKKAINDAKGSRKSGWEAEYSEKVALQLIKVQTDEEGKDLKLTGDRMGRLTSAMQITPKRVVQLIKAELKAAGGELDDTSEAFLLDLFDIAKFRKELVEANIIQSGGKGKKKKESLKDLFAA